MTPLDDHRHTHKLRRRTPGRHADRRAYQCGANNRAEVSHQPTRQQEYHRRGFSSATHAQRFLTLHGLTQNLFRLGRHLMQAVHYRLLRTQAFQVWEEAVCA